MDLLWLQQDDALSGFGFFISSFLACIAILPVAMFLARKIGLLDKPSVRKNHARATPLVGGVCIFISLCIVSLASGNVWATPTFLFWMFVVISIGVADDYLDISFAIRIAVHLFVVIGVWLTDELMISSIGAILNSESTMMFATASGLVFTAFAVIGAINTVNMIDGVDGLLGSLASISLCALLVLVGASPTNSVVNDSVFTPQDILILLGSLAAFLLCNLRLVKARSAFVFFGDAGSTFIGFVLVYMLINYSQGSDASFSPVIAGWILGLPLLDASAVIAVRLLRGRSPVAPGHDHMHHLLLARRFGVNRVVLTMISIHVGMIIFAYSVSVVLPVYSDLILFWGFISIVVFRVVLGYRASHATVKHYSRSFEEYDIPDKKRGAAQSTGHTVKASSSGKAAA